MFSSIVSLSKRVFPPFSPGTPHAKRACGSSPTATSTLTALPADAFCRVLILAIEATEADYYVRSEVAVAAELTVELLGNLSLVSTSLRDACQDDHLWRALCGASCRCSTGPEACGSMPRESRRPADGERERESQHESPALQGSRDQRAQGRAQLEADKLHEQV